MGQTFAIIGALVLLTTMILIINQSVQSQAELVYWSMYVSQAERITEKYFDKIFTEVLLAKLVAFDSLANNYAGQDSVQVSPDDVIYKFDILTAYTDSTGQEMADTTDYQLVTIKVWTQPPVLDTISFQSLYKRPTL
jgi:hypothetical protein